MYLSSVLAPVKQNPIQQPHMLILLPLLYVYVYGSCDLKLTIQSLDVVPCPLNSTVPPPPPPPHTHTIPPPHHIISQLHCEQWSVHVLACLFVGRDFCALSPPLALPQILWVVTYTLFTPALINTSLTTPSQLLIAWSNIRSL
jgi:hypothetical protein